MKRLFKWGCLSMVGLVVLAGILGALAGNEVEDAKTTGAVQSMATTPPVAMATSTVRPTATAKATPTVRPTSTPRATATSKPAPTPLPCLTPSDALTALIRDNLTVSGKSDLTAVRAIRISLSGSDDATWYLVGGYITGLGIPGDSLGVWVTTIEPSSAAPTGSLFSATSMAKEFSVFPRPKNIEGRFMSSDPDVRTISACVAAAAKP